MILTIFSSLFCMCAWKVSRSLARLRVSLYQQQHESTQRCCLCFNFFFFHNIFFLFHIFLSSFFPLTSRSFFVCVFVPQSEERGKKSLLSVYLCEFHKFSTRDAYFSSIDTYTYVWYIIFYLGMGGMRGGFQCGDEAEAGVLMYVYTPYNIFIKIFFLSSPRKTI